MNASPTPPFVPAADRPADVGADVGAEVGTGVGTELNAGVGLGVVVPARNEIESIPALAAALAPLRASGEVVAVVLVDNGSTDGTARAAREAGLGVVAEPARGYGAACQTGIAWLRALDPPPKAVGFLDADLADDPSLLPFLAAPVLAGEADLVLGQRTRFADGGALDPHQRFGNALATTLLRLATGRRHRDLGPMRVISTAALDRLEMADRTWGWTIEMQHKAVTRGLVVREVDVPYRQRTTGKSKISGSLMGSARAGVVIVRTIAALWWGERGRRGAAVR